MGDLAGYWLLAVGSWLLAACFCFFRLSARSRRGNKETGDKSTEANDRDEDKGQGTRGKGQ